MLQSYLTVQKPLLRLLDEIMDVDDDEAWHIYLTGHSMGGALATLTAYELSVCCQLASATPPGARRVPVRPCGYACLLCHALGIPRGDPETEYVMPSAGANTAPV